MPRPAVFNGLVVVKLKRDLKHRVHIYFEPVRPLVIYQKLGYLKSHKKLYEDISIAEGLSSADMFKFPDIVEIQRKNKNIMKKLFLIEKN